MRTRKSLSELTEGRVSCAEGRDELVKLATRLVIEEALEAESRDEMVPKVCEISLGPWGENVSRHAV